MGRAGYIFITAVLAFYTPSARSQGQCLQLFERASHALIHQETDYYCGPAVLQSALARQNIHVSQSELARLAKTTEQWGTSPEHMARAVTAFGLSARILSLKSIKQLKVHLDKSETVIALITSGGEAHWVILDSYSHHSIKIMDPWTDYNSLRTVSASKLAEQWVATFNGETYSHLAIVVSH